MWKRFQKVLLYFLKKVVTFYYLLPLYYATTLKLNDMKVLSISPQDGINANSHRKEKNFQNQYTLVAVYKGKLIEIANLRTYGTNAMNYACLWVFASAYPNPISEKHEAVGYMNGSGSAGGYGYHRPSAAAQEAFETAGIKLDESISGRGDGAIEIALLALGKKLGYRSLKVLNAHG